MKKNLELKRLALIIEWHWWFIMRDRKKCGKLIARGLSFTSQELIRVDNRIASHGTSASKASRRYEELAGIATVAYAPQQISA